MPVRNLDYIKSQDPRLYEALHDIISQQSNIAQQVNGNVSGTPKPPTSISGIQVSAQNGHFQVAIQDHASTYRDVHYYIEHADNPNFHNSQVIHNGHSRNWGGFMGNVTRYFRAYSAYPTSAAGSPAYHGGALKPQPVIGGGTNAGPSFLNSQGSGTGFPGQGISGPGPVPFRAVNGAPPIRGENTGTGASASGQSASIASGGLPPTGGT